MKLFKITCRYEIRKVLLLVVKLFQMPESKLILYLGAFNVKLPSVHALWTVSSDLTSSTNHHSSVQ